MQISHELSPAALHGIGFRDVLGTGGYGMVTLRLNRYKESARKRRNKMLTGIRKRGLRAVQRFPAGMIWLPTGEAAAPRTRQCR